MDVGDEAASKKQDTVASSGSDVAKSMDEDDREKKEVYIFMLLQDSAQLKVISFDPHKEDSGDSGFIDKTAMIEKDMPPALNELFCYTIVALGSKFYFIGGMHRDEGPFQQRASKRAFAFDTDSREWVRYVPCSNRRRSFPVAVSYENKIYLFGRASDESGFPFLPEYWAEVYDPTSLTWEYLPGAHPKELVKGYSNIIPAVMKHTKTLLICLRYFGVYSYSLDTENWLSSIPDPAFIDFGLSWSTSVAVFNNTLYWECFGCIFADDFPDTQGPVKTYTLPDAELIFGTPSPYDIRYVMTDLVNVGNGKLCLVYGSEHHVDVCCHTVELTEKFKLHQKHNDIYNCVPLSYVVSVVAMGRDVDRESERGPRDEDRGEVQEREQYCYHSRGEKGDNHERRQKNRKSKIQKDKLKQCVENGDWKTHKEIAQLHNKPKDNAGVSTSSQQDPQKSAEEEWKLPKKTARAMTASQAKDKGKLTVEGPSAAVDTTELVIHAVEHVTDASSRAGCQVSVGVTDLTIRTEK